MKHGFRKICVHFCHFRQTIAKPIRWQRWNALGKPRWIEAFHKFLRFPPTNRRKAVHRLTDFIKLFQFSFGLKKSDIKLR
jgi:hypothetical protein